MIVIEGFIDGFMVQDVRKQLKKQNGDLTIYINSGGGSVIDGVEIYNMLKKYNGKKTVVIGAKAMSMATYIAMVGDEIIAHSNSTFMMHNVASGTWGDHNEHRKRADVMEALRDTLATNLSLRSGKSLEVVIDLMDKETYLVGEKIREEGFADEIIKMENEKQNDDKVIQNAKEEFMNLSKQFKNKKCDDGKLCNLLNIEYENIAKPAEKPNMEVKNMTIEELRSSHKNIYGEIVAKAKKEEAKRIEAILAVEANGINKEAFEAIRKEVIGDTTATADTLKIKLFEAMQKKESETKAKANEYLEAKREVSKTVEEIEVGNGFDNNKEVDWKAEEAENREFAKQAYGIGG